MLCFLVSSPIVTWTSDAVTVEVKNPGNVTRGGAKYHLTQTAFLFFLFSHTRESQRLFHLLEHHTVSILMLLRLCCWMLVLSASPELLCSFKMLIFYWHKLLPSLWRQKTDLRWLNVSWLINFPTKYSAYWLCLRWDVINNRFSSSYREMPPAPGNRFRNINFLKLCSESSGDKTGGRNGSGRGWVCAHSKTTAQALTLWRQWNMNARICD